MVEARLACVTGGIEVTEDDTSNGVPYFKALERLQAQNIEGFGYNKNNEANLPMREHINILFAAVNDPETEAPGQSFGFSRSSDIARAGGAGDQDNKRFHEPLGSKECPGHTGIGLIPKAEYATYNGVRAIALAPSFILSY